MDEREAKLPGWARELIAGLRTRIHTATETLGRELVTLRPQVELLTRRNEALTELLECAARGQHKTAKEIVDILGTYDLILAPREK